MCPDVSEYHYLLGVAFMQAGDMILSVESLDRAEQLEPNRPLTLIAKGLALNNRSMFDEAVAALSRALELDPESLEGTAALAEAEQGLGQADKAEAHARRVLEKLPENATANLVLGQLLMRRGDVAAARDALLVASKADPVSPKPEYQLSLAYARLGDAAASERHRQLYEQKLRAREESLEALRKRTGLPGSGGMK
jgi:tetratricopeptide (TPR) repeat protein